MNIHINEQNVTNVFVIKQNGVQCIIVFTDESKFEIKITILFDDLPESIVNFMVANVII